MRDSGIEKATIIITPTTIVNIDNDPVIGNDDKSQKTTLVKWSCSLGRNCSFSDCIYSRAKMDSFKK